MNVFAGQYEPMSLAIEFNAERTANETAVSNRLFGTRATVALPVGGIGYNKTFHSTALVARLVMIQQEEIILFDGGCEKKSVFWDPAVAERAAKAHLGGGRTIANQAPKGVLSSVKKNFTSIKTRDVGSWITSSKTVRQESNSDCEMSEQ